MSFANPSVFLDGDREIVVVVGTTTCNRPRPQLPPDVDVGDDDSDSLPSKGSFSATLRVEEDIDLPDVPPCSVSCVEERARRQDSPGGGAHRTVAALVPRFFKFYKPLLPNGYKSFPPSQTPNTSTHKEKSVCVCFGLRLRMSYC